MISYQQFKAEWLGKRVDYDHVFAFQCVDLILQFLYECAGVGRGVSGNAIDYATKPTQAFLDAVVKVTDGSKVAGDILVFKSAATPDGHITLRDTNLDQMLEQNGADGSGSGVGRDAIGVYRNIPYDRLVAVYRIKQLVNVPAAVPASGSTSGFNVGDTVTVTNPVDVHGTRLGTSGNYTVTEIDNGSIVIGRNGAIIARVLGANLAKVESAPAPAPAAPQLPQRPANTIYTKLAAPLDLVTNKQPTNWWELGFVNDAHATAAAQLNQGTPFRAYGKAQRVDGDRPVYFMTSEDFGQADVTGIPSNNNGVNTVDLSPAPAPTPPPAPAAPETPTPPPAAAPAESEAVNVPVTVKSWQDTFDSSVAGTYKATKDESIHDLAGVHADVSLGHDQTVHVAGKVTKEGQDYYVTQKSHDAKNWYGIPAAILVRVTTPVKRSLTLDAIKHPVATLHTAVDDIDKISADLNKDPEFAKFKSQLTPRGKAVATLAEAEQKVDGFFDKVNLFKKKNQ